MPVYVTRSTDGGAPSLAGNAAGSLISVLDLALVTNAGWSKVYTGTNIAVYRAPGGLRHYIRIDDTGVAQFATARAYATMTDVNTGTDPYPTVAQSASGLNVRRSTTSDATARPWQIYASERSFYLCVQSSGTAALGHTTFFGDLLSFKAGDTWHSCLFSDTASNCLATHTRVTAAGAQAGHYVCRPHGQTGASTQVAKTNKEQRLTAAAGFGSDASASVYPCPITGGIKLSTIDVIEPVTSGWSERGRLPGLFAPLHQPFGLLGDTFPGTGRLAGRNFELLSDNTASTSGSRVAVQTNSEWYS